MAGFTFATCLPGLEPALKQDVARARPELRFAYSRPGLVTFKSDGAIADDDSPGSPLARVWGRSIGPARSPDDAAHQLSLLGATRVHVFARSPDDRWISEVWQGTTTAGSHCRSDRPRRRAGHGCDRLHRTSIEPPGSACIARGRSRALAGRARTGGRTGRCTIARVREDRRGDRVGGVARRERVTSRSRSAAHRRRDARARAARASRCGASTPPTLAPVVLADPRAHHLAVKVGALRWEQLPAARSTGCSSTSTSRRRSRCTRSRG